MKIKLDIYQRLHALEINLHNAGLSASAEQVRDAASAGCTSSEFLNDSHRALTQILTQESLPDELRKEIKSIVRSIRFVLFKINIGL